MLTLALLLIALDPAAAEWEQIQIDWIAETRTVRSLEQVLPRREAQLVRLLGSPDYTTRGLAQAELVRMGDAAYAALCWGAKVNDPHIAELCKLQRSRLFWCPACHGSGVCQACTEIEPESAHHCPDQCDWCRRCIECDGSGDLRYYRESFLDEDGEPNFELKVFWGAKHGQ